MSRRTIVSRAASIIVAIVWLATSTDAFAYRAGVGRAGIHHGGIHHGAVRRGVAVGAGGAAAGAYHAPRCGFLPLPPCY